MNRSDILENIKLKLSLVPKKPGCYQMKDEFGNIIYVGKAKILQNRLKSYFTGSHDAKTSKMVQNVHDFEYIITNSELEAFLLELNFIKEYRPKYNIMLMDDKTYPYIILTNEEHPRLMMSRDVKLKGKSRPQKIYGPFPNAKACRETVEVLNKIYPFRKCRNIPSKSCLYYDIKQCLAPCINKVDKDEYAPFIQSANAVLNGTDNTLLKDLNNKMEEASMNLDFEQAIEYRNIIGNIKELLTPQKMTIQDGRNRDIFGYFVKDGLVCVQILHMRAGKIIERSGEVFDIVDNLDDILLEYLYEFYTSNNILYPSELLIPYIEGYEIIQELLDINITVPVKGIKKQLVTLGSENAQNNLENLQKLRLMKISKTTTPLEELSKILNIEYPTVIEIFDNSNIGGVSPVSAMVTYINGSPSPKDYRKYKVKTVEGADDYHTMQEIILRRYSRLQKENGRMPNLIIVDGGKPQVRAAKEILDNLNLNLPLIGLAKDDRHRTDMIITSNLQEIKLDKKSNVFLILEAMQEEVHRFAITFFKQTHSKNTFTSIFDEIPGIGKKRKLLLMKEFENLDELANTSVQKLKSLGFPEKLANDILEIVSNRDK